MSASKTFTATEILGIESSSIEVPVEIKSKNIKVLVELEAPPKNKYDELKKRFFGMIRGKKINPSDHALDVAFMCLEASLVKKMDSDEAWKLLLLAGAEYSELGMSAIEVCGLGQFFDLRAARDIRDKVVEGVVKQEKKNPLPFSSVKKPENH